MKSSNLQTGEEGEAQALSFLLKKGFVLLHKNWRTGHLEVDLIMTFGNYLVFVEVKTRTSSSFGYPEKAVSNSKQKSLVKAANAYAEMYPSELNFRFDVVSVTRTRNNWEVYHIEDAFFPYDL